jgi:exodeoxyribonuclease VII large subunit
MAGDDPIPSFLSLSLRAPARRQRKKAPEVREDPAPQLNFDLFATQPDRVDNFDLFATQPDRVEPTRLPEPPTPVVYTVRQLIAELRQHLEGGYPGLLSVEGEISNCRPAASGHLYFTLKDGDAQLPVVLFRRQAGLLDFKPRDGMAVEVRGRISLYETRGQLQLIAETLRPRGTGALQLAFEQLRDRLRREGLFDRPRTPLPQFPQCIGIVTSTGGAALRDIIQVIRRRHARLNLLIYPATMQGPQCPPSVIAGIRFFNEAAQDRVPYVSPLRHGLERPQLPCVDLILIARGGGSIEDLAGFNDEALARAIVASKLPVVSAIGHEIDHTIADFVADLRAPTPSAAAELITAAQHRIEEQVLALERRVFRAGDYHLLRARQRFARLSAEAVLARVRDQIGLRVQRVDELQMRMTLASERRRNVITARLATLESRLKRQDPSVRLAAAQQRLATASARLSRVAGQLTAAQTRRLTQAKSLLERLPRALIDPRSTRLEQARLRLQTLSPLAVLNRGYAIVFLDSADGASTTILSDASAAASNQRIRAQLARGSVRAIITETEPATPALETQPA